jgi:hypothetical protein
VFPTPTYLAPDYATLAQRVKQTFRQNLGREPTESELAGLADELSSYHRQAFEAEVEQAQQDWQSRQFAMEGGINQHPFASGFDTTPEPGQVEAVDPLARFNERFDEAYQPDIDMQEREQQSGVSMANLMASLGIAQNAVGRVV